MNSTWWKVQSVLVILVFTPGCYYATTYKVHNLGVTQRRLEPHTAYVGSDGSMALEADLVQKHGKAKRYLYKNSNSLHNDLRYLRLTNPTYKDVQPVVITVDNSDSKGLTEDGSMKWRMIPANFGAKDARQEELPNSFSLHTIAFPLKDIVPYELDGNNLNLKFSEFSGLGSRSYGLRNERALWSYPAQLLLIPAAVVDALVNVYEGVAFIVELPFHLAASDKH